MTAVPIFLYHSVAPSASPDYAPWCVHPDEFDEHLHAIGESDYTPLSVSQFVDRRSAGSLPERPCLITFDDGRADFVTGAVPALERHDMPSTMYVVTGHVGGSSSWLPMPEERDQPMMTWDDLRALPDARVEIGAHSETHPELDVLSISQLRNEVARSRHRLADALGRGVRSFAYPHGYHSKRVVDAVREAGFDSASAVKDQWSHVDDDRFALSRMFVWNTTTADDIRRLLAERPSATPVEPAQQRALRAGWRCVRWFRHRSPASPR